MDRLASSSLADSWQRYQEYGVKPTPHTEAAIISEYDLEAHLRMYLSALRAVVEFLGKPKRLDDVVASDFLPEIGATSIATVPESMKTGLEMFNRRAGHLTYDRGEGVAVYHPLGHLRWLVDAFGEFVKRLDDERPAWFGEALDYVRRVTEGLEAQHSEAAVESTVGAFFFRQWMIHPTISFDHPRGEGPEHVPPPRFDHLVQWRR